MPKNQRAYHGKYFAPFVYTFSTRLYIGVFGGYIRKCLRVDFCISISPRLLSGSTFLITFYVRYHVHLFSKQDLLISCMMIAMMSSLNRTFICFKANPLYTKLLEWMKTRGKTLKRMAYGGPGSAVNYSTRRFRIEPTCQVIQEKLRRSLKRC